MDRQTNGRSSGFSRRALMTGAAASVGAGLLAPTAANALAPITSARTGKPADYSSGMNLVLLGTAGGPPPNGSRFGISSAIVVDGNVYIIDAGRGSVSQYKRADLALASLRGIFITHLHADHVGDYFNYFLLGGNANPNVTDSVPNSTPVFGPGPAGFLPPTFGGGESPTVNPENPTPGLAALTESCNQAFAYSTNVFMRDSRIRDTSTLADVREIPLDGLAVGPSSTAPAMSPLTVMEDEHVKVTAVLVPHGPVFPCFAYRFESEYGSVTFSGDTTYSDNLLTLAHDTDILVHEAINVQGWNGPAALKDHLLEGHVEVQRVGEVAQASNAARLVLSHIGDLAAGGELPEDQWRKWAKQGYEGRVDVGADLQTFRV
ncbi:MBL fold metallo-hydrolase [Agromyces sp. Soil535]|uniref:MBL fold metallo-hydrolase n=1 Tax=Agromyces sp. Soil535 TaxID=1736390 RepID=UPI000A9C1E19|nr:MBL fold metallo-hydrolase [Agromyces sp. Soil535]